MSGSSFTGELGQTSLETTTVWCGGCGAWFGAQIYRSIDADADPELVEAFKTGGFDAVNRLECGNCGWTYVAHERIAIHYPSREKVFLIVPEMLRHRAQRVRANFIEDVSRAPGNVVPLYVLEPVLVGGHAEFIKILAERETGVTALEENVSVDETEAREAREVLMKGPEPTSEPQPTSRDAVRRHTKSMNLLAELLGDEGEPDAGDGIPLGDIQGGLDLDGVVEESLQEVDPAYDEEGQRRSGRRETTGVSLKVLLGDEEPDGSSVDQSVDDEALVSGSADETSIGLEAELSASAASVNEADGFGESADPSEETNMHPQFDAEARPFHGDEQTPSGALPENLKANEPSALSEQVVQASEDSVSLDGAVPSLENAEEGAVMVDSVEDNRSQRGLSDERVNAVDGDAPSTDESVADSEADENDNSETEGPMESAPVLDVSTGQINSVQEIDTVRAVETPDIEPDLSEDPQPETPDTPSEHVMGIVAADDGVRVRFHHDSALAESLKNARGDLLFQVHRTDSGAVRCLTYVLDADSAGDTGSRVACFEPASTDHMHCLEFLSEEFKVCIELIENEAVRESYSFSRPLEGNVRACLDIPEEEWSELGGAAVQDPSFELHGGMSHNFTEDHFDRLSTAAETQVALGIVGYWADHEQEEHLLLRKSFPAQWWAGIKLRCVEASLQFGICPTGPLNRLMVQVGRFENEDALVRQLLTSFAEVNMNLRPNEMDPISIWENWDRLLSWSDTLGIEVDTAIEEIAARALEAAERFSVSSIEPSDESYEAIEISLADAIDIESLGAFNLRFDGLSALERKAANIIEPAMSELDELELLDALRDVDKRAGACVQLIGRGLTKHAASIFDAIMNMSPMELVVVVPSVLPIADAFVPLFRGALFADEMPQRMSAAMLLAEVGDERALNSLLAMMLEADEEHWELLAASAARLGPTVIQPALSRAAVDEQGLSRISVLLGYVTASNPGCLDAVRERHNDPVIAACLSQAQAVGEALGPPETPPFAHRLATLFEAVQHGSVSHGL